MDTYICTYYLDLHDPTAELPDGPGYWNKNKEDTYLDFTASHQGPVAHHSIIAISPLVRPAGRLQ